MAKAKAFSRLISRDDIARYLGITRMTLYRWSKIVPLTSYPGKHVWMDEDEVDIWRKKVRAEEHRLFMKRIT